MADSFPLQWPDGWPRTALSARRRSAYKVTPTRAYNDLVREVACDKWTTVHSNMRAMGLALEALRAIDRAGATQILERAFSAFGALPASSAVPEKRAWWEVFGLSQDLVGMLSIGMVDARFRELSKKMHPDVLGGSAEAMAELNQAMTDARAHFGAGPVPPEAG